MIFPAKSLLLYLAIALTGLSAGLFYAWAVSVIPGTQKVSDLVYLESMQHINRAILNPAFFLIFFGPLVAIGLSIGYHYQNATTLWLLLLAGIAYLFGTFGITAFGNVPLNDELDLLNLVELSPAKRQAFRQAYEGKWNRLHLIRTIAAVVSFLLTILTPFIR
jgi:uncharacterized membrane protein